MVGRLRVCTYALTLATGLGGGAILGAGPAAADGGHGSHAPAWAHDQGASGQGHHGRDGGYTGASGDETAGAGAVTPHGDNATTTTPTTDEPVSSPGTEPTTSDPERNVEVSSHHHKTPPALPTSTT